MLQRALRTMPSSRCGRLASVPSTAPSQTIQTATWEDTPGLTKTIDLTSERPVLIQYHLTFQVNPRAEDGGYHYCATTLNIDNVEQAEGRSISGLFGGTNVVYGTAQATWIGTLGAGSHVIKVMHRTTKSFTLGGGWWHTAGLQVLVL